MPQTTGKTSSETVWLGSVADWSTSWTAGSQTASDSIIMTAYKRTAPPEARSLNNYMTVLASPSTHVSQPLALVVLDKKLVDGVDASYTNGSRHRQRHSSGLDSIQVIQSTLTNAWLSEPQGYEFGKRNREGADVACKFSSS
jgi:hypothetical protein